MENEPETTSSQLPAGPPQIPTQQAMDVFVDTSSSATVPQQATFQPTQTRVDDGLVHCPSCSSTQFFGSKKVSGLGWTLYISAIANIFISGLLMFVFIGFLTIFLSPILAMIGFYGCRKHVNTCARCKRDF